jgi:hypothetical protein
LHFNTKSRQLFINKETIFVKVLSFSAKKFGAVFLLLISLAVFSFGQQPTTAPTPTLIIPAMNENLPVATGSNLYCAGYIQSAPVNTNFEIVGANQEREQNIYAQGNYIYISRGAGNGSRIGDRLAVIRPRGKFSSDFSKKGRLGIYVQEVGDVEIVDVQEDVSVAKVITSCDNFLLGDLIVPIPHRTSPLFQQRPALNIFANPSGKQTGRIVLARDARETMGREEIVYIDLGAEDNVQIGDYLTIFRKLGKGGAVNSNQEETLDATEGGFESGTFKGGEFSNQAPRKAGDMATEGTVTQKDAKKNRPKFLRKVVGEMIILNVKERTATAMITRSVEEIHTGDMVEVQ